MPKYKIHHIGTCTPDYFCGYHNPVIQVIVDGTTTYNEIFNELTSSINTNHIEDLDSVAYTEAVEDLKSFCIAALGNNNPPETLDKIFDKSIEICPEDEEDNWCDCYAFFGLDTEDEGEE